MIKMKYITVEQPIGTLFFGCLSVKEISQFTTVKRRTSSSSKDGIQRKLDKKRLEAISLYSENSDSIFPTPIIISGNSYLVNITENYLIINEILEEDDKFNIVDGQHRLFGIKEAPNGDNYNLPVAIILNTTLEEEAHIFSIINGNQKPVAKSLIYDLFSHTDKRSFERTGHLIAQELNSDNESPFYQRLKMLGFTEKIEKDDVFYQIQNFIESNNDSYLSDEDYYRLILEHLQSYKNIIAQNFIRFLIENPNSTKHDIQNYLILDSIPTLSQGIFIDILLEYLTNDANLENQLLRKNIPLDLKNNSKLIFREYFLKKQDNMIYKTLKNYFNAIKYTFPKEWADSKNYILAKSTGYMALMRLLPDIFEQGRENNFNEEYFISIFTNIKNQLPSDFSFSSQNYGSSKSGASKLYKELKSYL